MTIDNARIIFHGWGSSSPADGFIRILGCLRTFHVCCTLKLKSQVDVTSANSKSFAFEKEGHTLGNSLRHMVVRQPNVDLCGYTIPHPMEDVYHMRIQTDGSIDANTALDRGLTNLAGLCDDLLKKINDAHKEFESRS